MTPMKKTRQYLILACTLLLTSCNLFIDEDLERQLMEYSGKGYDAVVSDSTDNFSVTYQYKKTTMELNANNPLTKHITRVETIEDAKCHYIHFDGATPQDMLPRVGQHIVSNNIDVFPFGLCALVGIVEKEGGEWVVTCKSTDVKDAFEYLQFHASVPAGDYFDEFDVYDGAGDFLVHVDNREENAKARAEARTRGDEEEAEKFIPLNIPIGLPPMSGSEYDALKTKLGLPSNLTITYQGSIKGKLYADCDFDWDKGLNIKFSLKEGCFTDSISIVLTGGMDDMKKILGNDDILNGKIRLTVGPVVVVPVFGFSVNFQIYGSLEASLKYTKPFEIEVGFVDGDFYSKDTSGKSTTELKIENASHFDLPIVKLSLGFGLFSSDLSLRAEIYAKLASKVGVSISLKDFGAGDEPLNCDFNPKITVDFGLGIAVALVAKGMIISKVLSKIKSHVKERSGHMQAMTNYFSNGSYADWVALKNGEYVNPETLAEMEKILGNKTGKDREDLIDSWVKAKAKENYGLKGLSDKAIDTEMTGHVVQPGEGEADKEFALRLGPFYPKILEWNIMDRYIFPKMKEGSFKIGQKWTAPDEPIVFTAEWTVEDPGLITYLKAVYPCFTIKSGSDFIDRLFVPNKFNASLTGDTPKGTKYSVEIPGMLEDVCYGCIPGYALTYGGKPVVQDKGLAFAAFTPTISILKLEKSSQEEVIIDHGFMKTKAYRIHFVTHTSVTGLINIKEWGILDLNDTNPDTQRHKSSSSVLHEGSYAHSWTVTSASQNVTVRLRPYIFGRDATNLKDISQAKLFPIYEKTLKYKSEYDFTEDSRYTTDLYDDGGQDYTITLDSVTYIPAPL